MLYSRWSSKTGVITITHASSGAVFIMLNILVPLHCHSHRTRADLSRQARDSESKTQQETSFLPSVFACVFETGILRDVYIPRAELYRYVTFSRCCNLNSCIQSRSTDFVRTHARACRTCRKQALQDAAAGQPFNTTAIGKSYAQLAYKWQTGYPSTYPTDPVGDPVAVSTELYKKYSRYFRGC